MQLKAACDIVSIISSYVPLKQNGRNRKCLCPFHLEKTPSFVVYEDTQSFYCYGCGAGGDVITFIMRIENLEYLEALKLLAERVGLPLPENERDDQQAKLRQRLLELNRQAARYFHSVLKGPDGKSARDYFAQRRLSAKTIVRYGLGYAPDSWNALRNTFQKQGYSYEEMVQADLIVRSKSGSYYDKFRNRVIFPILDLRGNVIAFGGRVLDDQTPKYVNTSDTLVFQKKRNLFSLNFAKNSREKTLILAEGYMDVIAMHQAGFTGAVATLGTALTSEQARLISRYADDVVIAYDSDEAGQKATARSLAMFNDADIDVRVLSYQGAKDPDEFIKKYGKERFAMLLDGSADPTEFQLKKAAANYDLRGNAGRLNYLKDAIDILTHKGVSPTARDVYAGRLAEETGVSKKAILEQMADVLRSTQRRDRRKEQRDLAGQGNAADIRVPYTAGGDAALGAASAGRQLIAALLQSPEKIPYVRQRLNMDTMVLPEMQEALRAIFRCADEHLPVNITSLQQMLDEKPMAEVNRAQAVNAGHTLQQEDIDMYLERLENAKPVSQTVKGTTDDQFLSAFTKLRKEKGAADPPPSD